MSELFGWLLFVASGRVPIMQCILLHLIVTATLCALARADVFSLSNLSWTLKNANGSIVIPAQVPSQAHLDLMRAGIITEPLLGINGM